MPTYRFQNMDTKKKYKKEMKISELDQYLEENKNVKQLLNGFPGSIRSHNKKPDAGFRDLLKDIKKRNSKGLTQSTIDTW
jgi:antibiotic biosynthesis monooxygenase (ABM) superfamily enzyme